MKSKRIVVAGYMGACPMAGIVWQHVHYIVGLQRLGHEVFYVEESGWWPYNPLTKTSEPDPTNAISALKGIAERFGFQGRWAFCSRFLPDSPCAGLSRAQVNRLYKDADCILSICGVQELHDDVLASNRIVYVESDPGLEQIKVDKKEPDTISHLKRHYRLFTFGENIGTELFPVPLYDLNWLPTRQPVVIDFWNTDSPPPAGAVFTSIASWSTAGVKDVDWRGQTYLWSKSLEFMKFVDAPVRSAEPFELATNIPDSATFTLFLRNNWRIVPPDELSIYIDQYRDYIQSSKGEFTAAKDQYVRLNTGWFSDRSACYLAAGRPVITQETGFTRLYGGDRGLFGFSSMEDIVEAVHRINSDYATHSAAALEIAKEYFEAEKVIKSLLDRAGI